MSLLLHLRRAHFVNGEGEKEGEGGTTVFETSHCQDCARQDEDIIICRVGDQALQESGVRTILNDGLISGLFFHAGLYIIDKKTIPKTVLYNF